MVCTAATAAAAAAAAAVVPFTTARVYRHATTAAALPRGMHLASSAGLRMPLSGTFGSMTSSAALKGNQSGEKSRGRVIQAGLVIEEEDHDFHHLPEALLFDCDGVLVDTERDGHRVSFNKAFKEKGLNVEWGVKTYGKLLEIGGGKERMTHFFNEVGWPESAPKGEDDRKAFVAELHRRKTDIFMDLINTAALPLRPGVARLIDEALAHGVKVAVCSTSSERSVASIVLVMLGMERAEDIMIFAGDVVPKKKPDPAIYNLAAQTLEVNPGRCIVIEDSHIGLSAAKAAGMTCVVTKSGYTANEDFSKADAIYDEIGDYPDENFDLVTLCNLMERNTAKA